MESSIRISELPKSRGLTGGESIPIVQDNSTKRAELKQILPYLQSENAGTLPKLFLSGDMSGMKTKADVKNIQLQYIDGSRSFSAYAKIKFQGTSSMEYPKKNFTINLYADEAMTTAQKVEMVDGWSSQSKYCLKADYIDCTHARNVVSAKLASQMQAKYELLASAPRNGLIDGFPIKLYKNGKYEGIYNWNIPKDGWQFAMDKTNPNHILFVAESNLLNSSCNFRAAYATADWSCEFGDVSVAVPKLERLINFIKDSTVDTFLTNASQYLDLDACYNYFCFLYFGDCEDNVAKNMLLVTYDGNIWYPSLYDLDSTWGIKFDGTTLPTYTAKCQDSYNNSGKSLLWDKLVAAFHLQIEARYRDLRKSTLSVAHVISEFETYMDAIGSDLYEEDVSLYPRIPQFAKLTEMRNFIANRAGYVDLMMQDLTSEPVSSWAIAKGALTFSTAEFDYNRDSPGDTINGFAYKIPVASIGTGRVVEAYVCIDKPGIVKLGYYWSAPAWGNAPDSELNRYMAESGYITVNLPDLITQDTLWICFYRGDAPVWSPAVTPQETNYVCAASDVYVMEEVGTSGQFGWYNFWENDTPSLRFYQSVAE